MTTKIEFYDRLREHLPEPAAKLIAEEMRLETELASKGDLTSGLDRVIAETKLSVEQLRSSTFRFMLLFFVPLWIGVYGTLVAVLVRGS